MGIKALPKILLALTAVAAVSLAYPASVQAVPITYQYTGNPFTTVSGPYTTSMFVTATVTLSSPLAANTNLTHVMPLAFSLSDGVQTITNLNSFVPTFIFATGPTGLITQWYVLVIAGPSISITTSRVPGEVRDWGQRPFPGFDAGSNVDAPGSWAAASVPDVGSSLALLSLSLTALGVAARQFKRAAA